MKAFVLAGNYGEYRAFCESRQLDPSDYPYLRTRSDLDGIRWRFQVIKVGSYYKRSDIAPMVMVLVDRYRAAFFSESEFDEMRQRNHNEKVEP